MDITTFPCASCRSFHWLHISSYGQEWTCNVPITPHLLHSWAAWKRPRTAHRGLLFFFSPPQKRQASAILNAYTCAVVSLTNIWPHHAALSLLPHKGTGEENMMKKGSTVEIRTGRSLTNLPSWAKQTGHREINLLPASNRLEQWELLWAWSTSCSNLSARSTASPTFLTPLSYLLLHSIFPCLNQLTSKLFQRYNQHFSQAGGGHSWSPPLPQPCNISLCKWHYHHAMAMWAVVAWHIGNW